MIKNSELKRIYTIIFIPLVFIILLWLVKISEYILGVSLAEHGLFPLKLKGLLGIITSPFLHSGFKHLISNTVPLFFLAVSIQYFYKKIAHKVFIIIYIFTNLMVWFFGREAYHIGASGLVYGFASFLFFSGIISKYYKLLALSLVILFLYGSMIWGIFPLMKNISFESHLFGFVGGFILAYYFKDYAPKRPEYDWEKDDYEEDEIEEELEKKEINIFDSYHITDEKKDND